MVNVVMTAEKELKADVVEGTVKIGFCDSRYCTMEDKIIDSFVSYHFPASSHEKSY